MVVLRRGRPGGDRVVRRQVKGLEAIGTSSLGKPILQLLNARLERRDVAAFSSSRKLVVGAAGALTGFARLFTRLAVVSIVPARCPPGRDAWLTVHAGSFPSHLVFAVLQREHAATGRLTTSNGASNAMSNVCDCDTCSVQHRARRRVQGWERRFAGRTDADGFRMP